MLLKVYADYVCFMKKVIQLFIGIFSFIGFANCQEKPVIDNLPSTFNPLFKQKLHSLLSFTAPIISVEELKKGYDEYIVLDTRAKKEYEVSHLPGAIFVDYSSFDYEKIASLVSGKNVVVYCSVGYRSEKVVAKMKAQVATEVYNLFGSIFEWKNKGFEVVDSNQQPTDKVHTYNKSWGKWLEKGIKVY